MNAGVAWDFVSIIGATAVALLIVAFTFTIIRNMLKAPAKKTSNRIL